MVNVKLGGGGDPAGGAMYSHQFPDGPVLTGEEALERLNCGNHGVCPPGSRAHHSSLVATVLL